MGTDCNNDLKAVLEMESWSINHCEFREQVMETLMEVMGQCGG